MRASQLAVAQALVWFRRSVVVVDFYLCPPDVYVGCVSMDNGLQFDEILLWSARMLTIYSVPVAAYCAKLRIVMRHKSITFDERPPPGGYGSDEYRAIVPSGNLPAMFHDGFMLSDSEAIAEYLEEAFPETPMLPESVQHRAKAREFSRSHDTRLEPAVRALYPHVDYRTRDDAVVARLGAGVSKQLAALALLLDNSPLDPGRLWIGDCGFAVTFPWIKAFEAALSLPVEWPDAVLEYQARLLGFDAVAVEVAAYRPAMDDYLAKAYRSS